MDYFEGIVRTLLEREGYWVHQSFKVNLTKKEKRDIGKPSIPRPEIDLVALDHRTNEIIVMEVKSLFDSPGVRAKDLASNHDVPAGGYKLFTCGNYRDIVLARLRQDLLDSGMIDSSTSFRLGLAAGNVYSNDTANIAAQFAENSWLFWSPGDIKAKVFALAQTSYENEPAIITAKILAR